MEKKEFIAQLRKILLERGFDKDTVEAEMVPVSAYLDENKMKDIEIPVEGMADEITAMLREQEKEEEPGYQDDIEAALLAPAEKPEPEIPEDGQRKANPKSKLEKIAKAPKAAHVREEADTPAGADKAAQPEELPESGSAPTPEPEEETYSADAEVEDIDQFSPKRDVASDEKPGLLSRFVLWLNRLVSGKKSSSPEGEEAAEYDDGKNKVLFWVLFAVAIPIVVALALVAVGLYIAFWIALALLMIFLVAGLILFVFGGALIALIGIIYGVIMIIKGEMPVGLFEIGLGITVGAAVLLIGILIYNLAIRLIPYCMKLLARLLTFALKRSKEGLTSLSKTIKTI